MLKKYYIYNFKAQSTNKALIQLIIKYFDILASKIQSETLKKKSIWSTKFTKNVILLKSPHVHKKAQESFEQIIYKVQTNYCFINPIDVIKLTKFLLHNFPKELEVKITFKKHY